MLRQSYRVKKAGSLKNLQLKEEELLAPASGEVTIRVKAIGLNFADLFAIMGLYSATPKGSFVPGLEFAGEVIKTGQGVENLQVGQKVMGVTRFGGYTTHLNIDQRYVIPLPPGWSFEQGAAFPVQVLTAYYALVTLGNVQKGQTVLIHSAAGGVGLLANRICKKLGVETIGVVGSKEKLELLNKENYNAALLRSNNFKQEVLEALKGKELNLVLETNGDKFLKWSYELLAPMGRLISYGSAQFTPAGSRPNYIKLALKYIFRPRFDPLSMIVANKSLMAFNLIWLYEKADLMWQLLNEIENLKLDPPFVGRVFEFGEIHTALSYFQSGKSVGKVIVKI